MLFIGLALLIAAGLAVFVNTGAGALIGLDQGQTAQLLPLLIILIVIAGGAFSRRHRAAELLNGVLIWGAIAAVAGLGFAYRGELGAVAARVSSQLRPGIAVVNADRGTATFARGGGGHFEVMGTINGHTLPLIFDTGASAMVLTTADAESAGIDTSALAFDIPVSTANGTGQAARIRLDRIEIGGIVRTKIAAFVTSDEALDTSLLGMTFLETLTRYSVSSDSLELTE